MKGNAKKVLTMGGSVSSLQRYATTEDLEKLKFDLIQVVTETVNGILQRLPPQAVFQKMTNFIDEITSDTPAPEPQVVVPAKRRGPAPATTVNVDLVEMLKEKLYLKLDEAKVRKCVLKFLEATAADPKYRYLGKADLMDLAVKTAHGICTNKKMSGKSFKEEPWYPGGRQTQALVLNIKRHVFESANDLLK